MIIYLLTCCESGKSYVGQTVDALDIRWKEHLGCAAKGQTLLYRAIRKYGPEAFERRILEECSESESDDRECHWIAELKTLKPDGYNMTEGGQGARGYKHAEEMKQHISNVLKGRIFSEEHRRKLSIAHTGRRHTEETKRKCRDAVRRRQPERHPPDCTCGKHFTGLKRRLLTSQDVQNAHKWYSAGATWKQIAELLGVSNSTLARAVRRHDNQTRMDTTEKSI